MEKELENYILNHIDREDDVLIELDRETNLNVLGARMLSGHLQGKVLYMLAKMIQPNRILEIGTYTGYSAICMAKGLGQNGLLYTIEEDDELEGISKRYFKKAGIEDKIVQIIGKALNVIPQLDEIFDLVFIDADKREYVSYYDSVFGKVKKGGFIIADNILWNGKVIKKLAHGDMQTKGIMEFNEMVKNDDRVEKVIFPLRDGMTVIRKK